MPGSSRQTLRALTLASGAPGGRSISDPRHGVPLNGLAAGSNLGVAPDRLRGRSVLLATAEQLPTVLAALALDGIARRILLCPPDLNPAHLPGILADAEVDAIVSDGTGPATDVPHGLPVSPCGATLDAGPLATPGFVHETEWLLFTSGTTGRPKMVVHTLPSLTGPLTDRVAGADGAVWSTFYDVRRYGGLQILLRALLGGASMVLSSAAEPVGDFLTRVGGNAVTHMSGTPSHWRRALMSPFAGRIGPAYVRLSGEIADQGILDALRAAYPQSQIAHAFASTEAGVGFDVRDGLAGFPAAYVGRAGAAAELRVEDGTLRLRSSRTADRYLGASGRPLGGDRFVDTGDRVELRGDRYHFLGRREGVINVGGQKVYPEDVEAVINSHPDVRMSRVWSRPSPITGAVVAADIVVRRDADGETVPFDVIRRRVLEACRGALPAYKVPATVREVAALEIAPSGKLVRPHA
jgi:acyl-CoA synthetase (AMP-forming)/AMP-acid ligase II